MRHCNSLPASTAMGRTVDNAETALKGEQIMSNNLSISRRWAAYRSSKGGWLWSCVGASIATMILGFTWGGWVTGGSATRRAADAAHDARAQLAAASCVYRFNQGPDMAAQLAALKKVQSYEVNGLLEI